MKEEKIYNIGIVDDEQIFLNGLSLLINQNAKFNICLTANNGLELLNKLADVNEERPDLILCDLEMPVMDGVDTIKELSKLYPQIKLVVLSSHYDAALVLKMLEIGASAFVPKDEKPVELFETLTNVLKSGFHYNSHIVQLIREKMLFGVKSKRQELVVLSKREKEVLIEICNQRTNKEIAENLFISVRTVEGHRNNLIHKTQSKNTAGIIIYAITQGFYKVDLKNEKWA